MMVDNEVLKAPAAACAVEDTAAVTLLTARVAAVPRDETAAVKGANEMAEPMTPTLKAGMDCVKNAGTGEANHGALLGAFGISVSSRLAKVKPVS